ncbi:hypothetical protein KJ359_009071 [Pestalotiopsis sp. 9143b]|nr:hypothetical protein KJ359_009071 [Pestalotiopsis sp. 9143b]
MRLAENHSHIYNSVGSNALYGKQVTDRIVMADLTFTSFGFVAWSVTQVVLVQASAIVLSTIAAKNELLAMGLTLANNNCPRAQNVALGTTPSQATPSQTTPSQNTAPRTHPESSSVPAITVTSPEPSTTPPLREWSTGAVELSTLSPLGREILRPPQKPFAVAESTDDSFVGSSKATHPNAHSSSPVYPNFSTLSPCTSQSSLSSSTVFEEWRHSPKPISPRQPPGWARPEEPQPVRTYLSPDEWVGGRSPAPPRADPEPDPKSPPRAPLTEPPLEQVTSRSRVRDSYGSIDIVRTVVCTYESASSTAAQEMRAELVNPFDAAFATPGSGRRSYEVTITGGDQNRVPTRDLTSGTRDNESV